MLNAIALATALATPSPSPAPVSYLTQINVSVQASVHHSTAWQTCDRVARPLKYGLQLADALQTAASLHHGRAESDPVSKTFGPHNPMVGFLGTAFIDIATDLVSRRSPALRCGLDVRQVLVEEGALRVSALPDKP